MKGIKARVVMNYILIITITVCIFGALLIMVLRQYYIDNVEEILTNQAEVCGNFYKQYLYEYDLERDGRKIMENFSSFTQAQVQIIDAKGSIIVDSIGQYYFGDNMDFSDVKIALTGTLGKWKGEITDTKEPILSVSYPLKSGDRIKGVVRFVTSLAEVNRVLTGAAFLLIIIGIMVIVIAFAISILLSSSIINPVKEITIAAKEMASGNFDIRIVKKYDDEIGSLAEDLNYMASEITYHQHLKDNFITSISHELRTPLTSIKGWIVTLLSGEMYDEAEIYEGLQIINKESDRLTMLVDELLDFSKLTTGELKLNKNNINLNDILIHIGKQMEPRAQKLGIDFTVTPLESDLILNADENRVKQILINLIDNAFKYTPSSGRVVVNTIGTSTEVIIEVKDTGSGIPSEELSKITKRFYKVNNREPGSGIGLAICDELIKLHKGKLEIRSEVDIGTNVIVTLPI